MPRGVADAGLGRSLSFAAFFSGAVSAAFVGGAGLIAADLGVSTLEAAPNGVGALDDLVDGAAAAMVDCGALAVGVETAPACDVEVDVGVGAGIAPVGGVALATFVVGHRAP